MSKITLEQWREVAHDGVTRKELLKNVSFNDLVSLVREKESAFATAIENLKAARQAFIDSCQQRDQAIDQERANLQKEVSDQENRIRSLSAQYQKALGAGKVALIPDLKKQIAAATAARDEAQSTLAALDGVSIDYDRNLYEAAEKAAEPVKRAKEQLREVQNEVGNMRDVLELIFRYDSDEYYEIRNAGSQVDISRYDPQHWSEWSSKISRADVE